MVNKIGFTFVVFSGVTIAACNFTPQNHTAEIARMEDTIFKVFPTVNRVSLEIKGDFGTEMFLTLGDVELYNAPEAERLRVTSEATKLTEYIFGEKTPGKGSVIFVEEESTITVNDAAKKTYPMPLAPQE